MNKKIIAVFVTTLIFLATASYPTVAVSPTPKTEVKNITLTPSPSEAVTDNQPEVTVAPKVEYILPYPGVLPDHPLYFMKVWRDEVMDFLIRDPLKRIEFNVLMADKRIAMSMMLTEKGKTDVAVKVVTEAEQFMDQAFGEAKKTTEQGRVVRDDIVKKIETSLAKHREVVTGLMQKGPENVQEGYQKALTSITANQDKIPSIGK